MKRTALGTAVLVVSALLFPATALGKGASEAQIAGPGLSHPIQLGGSGDVVSAEQLGGIAEAAGFFAAVFRQTPDPMLAERPKGPLGARYTISYVMPGPNNQEDTLVQDVYPYAMPNPVTYTKPGQRFWTTERTRGGWYVAEYSALKEQLVAAGLPPSAPRVDGGGGGSAPWILVGSLVSIGLALCVGAVIGIGRRRPRTVAA